MTADFSCPMTTQGAVLRKQRRLIAAGQLLGDRDTLVPSFLELLQAAAAETSMRVQNG